MRLFLAGTHGYGAYIKKGLPMADCKYLLESFVYIKDWHLEYLDKFDGFMLDSGAFTYLNGAKTNVDWDKYIDRYAAFIKKYQVKHYIELDIDSVVGLAEVERLRDKLESLVGYPSIPVWHKSRGKDYWLKMVKDYDYVAIGGIVTKEIKPAEYKYFHWLLNEARKADCKVHGLGFTNLKGLQEYPFYSVDSTSWNSGGRFGAIYKFDGRTMQKYDKPIGTRVKTIDTAINNFREWVKFQHYMDK